MALVARYFEEAPSAPREAKRECPFEGELKSILELAHHGHTYGNAETLNQRIEAIWDVTPDLLHAPATRINCQIEKSTQAVFWF
jgi:hypothetical protein